MTMMPFLFVKRLSVWSNQVCLNRLSASNSVWTI